MNSNLQIHELKLYELLGIRLFRKMVFKLEKMIHHKDKGRNTNYHLTSFEADSLDTFIKFLFYNGAIHARNILYFVVYIFLHLLFHWHFYWFDLIFLLLAIKDVYCIMLQRYNYIRINERKKRIEQKKIVNIRINVTNSKVHFSENYDPAFLESDLAIIRNMKRRIENGDSIVISESEQETLKRITAALHGTNASQH